jgi:heme O synthase-like polyprenyltransferase
MPPLIGWAAASGTFKLASMGTLRHVIPLAVSAFHGYRVDVSGRLPAGWILSSSSGGSWRALYVLASHCGLTYLVPVGLGPVTSGGAGLGNTVADFLLSAGSFYFSACLAFARSNAAARQLLMASIIYLPAAFFLKVFEKS